MENVDEKQAQFCKDQLSSKVNSNTLLVDSITQLVSTIMVLCTLGAGDSMANSVMVIIQSALTFPHQSRGHLRWCE